MWDALTAWFQSPAGQRAITSAILPALAILVAGVVAALIARSAVRAVLRRADRDAAAAAVSGLLDVAGASADWTRLDGHERRRAQRLRAESDLRVRLLPRPGAVLAADWAALRIDALRTGGERTATAKAELDELRERLLAWLVHPRRAKRLFGEDVRRRSAEQDTRRAASPAAVPQAESAIAVEAERKPEPEPERELEPPSKQERRPEQAVEPQPTAPAEAEAAPEPAQPAKEEPAVPERTAPPTRPETEAGADSGLRLPSTEPVTVQRPRAEVPEPVGAQGAFARADHARHARPADKDGIALSPAAAPAAPAATAAAVSATTTPAVTRPASPAWLDDYDDDADVTQQSMDLKTPRPVAANSVRDRRHTGDNILPRN